MVYNEFLLGQSPLRAKGEGPGEWLVRRQTEVGKSTVGRAPVVGQKTYSLSGWTLRSWRLR